MIPSSLLESHSAQIVIGLILLAWQAWLSKIAFDNSKEIVKLNTCVFNHYSSYKGRLETIEKQLGITPAKD
jgi:hypothetical protein